MNKISVFSVGNKFNRESKEISALARKVFLLLERDGYSVDFYLVGNATIKRINRIYRKKDKVTNVLSFCEPKGFIGVPSKRRYLGEIYISPDFIRANKQDLRQMVAHGMLHLLGYDHETAKGRAKMEKKESSILRDI